MKRESGRGIFIRILGSLAALLLVLGLAGTSAHAQSTATLDGTVTDASGAVVAGARVVVKNQATGVESSSQTDNAGAYLFSSLPIGIYHIEVTSSGFQSAVISDLKLEVASSV